MTRQKLEQSSGKVTRLTTGVGYCHWLQPSDHLGFDDYDGTDEDEGYDESNIDDKNTNTMRIIKKNYAGCMPLCNMHA